jgi:hypothetical protein
MASSAEAAHRTTNASSNVLAMHPPRPPAIPPGTQALLWAVGLGGFVFVGMLSISISKSTSLITAIGCGFVIFLAVRLFGEGAPERQSRGNAGRSR